METEVVTQHWAVGYAADSGAVGVFARGNLEMLDARPVVAVTGARAATGYGSHVAAEIAAVAVDAGASVASGGAYGIDAATVRATLAAGGKPIVWLASGLDRAYPAAHSDLYGRVLEAGGLLLSLQPDGTIPTRQRFMDRSHALGAFADVSVIVEAGARSGALQVAGAALEAQRRVLAVPGPITSAASAGANALLRDARVEPLVTTDNITDYLNGGTK